MSKNYCPNCGEIGDECRCKTKPLIYSESEHQSLLEKAIADARFKHLQEATDKMFNVARERDDLQAKLDEANKRVEHVNLMLRTGAKQNLSLQGQVETLRFTLKSCKSLLADCGKQVGDYSFDLAIAALETPPPEPSEQPNERKGEV